MSLRTAIICLLVVALTVTSAARPPALSPDEDLPITPEEEREARDVVGEFNQKFSETNDIAPLIEEYFAPDFASRLSQLPNTFPFPLIEWKDENAKPEPEDLQRFYVAATNFLHDYFPLYAVGLRNCALQKGEAGDETCKDERPKLKKVLPPAAIKIVEATPLLKEWLGSEDDDTPANAADARAAEPSAQEAAPVVEAVSPGDAGTPPLNECIEGCAKAEEDQAQPIRNEKELRQLTSVLESLNKVLRGHLEAHPVSFKKDAAEESGEAEGDEFLADFDPGRIKIFDQPRVLGGEFYGYPKGTRLVCAEAGALHVELVRVDGRLRILTVYLLIDD